MCQTSRILYSGKIWEKLEWLRVPQVTPLSQGEGTLSTLCFQWLRGSHRVIGSGFSSVAGRLHV